MRRTAVVSVLFFFAAQFATAQQTPYTSLFDGTKAYWNPAATGSTPHMQTDVWFRQQWLGFGSTAPRTGFIGFQMPFVDQNMAAGGMVTFDQTGPVSKVGLLLNYAYQLRGVLSEDSQLSLGISGGFQQYSFSNTDVIFYDVNDVLLQDGATSSLYPTVGAGIHYLSSTDEYYENVFFFGLSYNQLYATNVLVNGFNQERRNHMVLNVGSRIYSRESYIEPSLTVNVTSPEFVDFIAGAKYELENVFWAGLGYSSVNELMIQGGVIIDRFGSRDGQLKLGVIANIGVSDNISNFGPGAEFYAAYMFDMD